MAGRVGMEFPPLWSFKNILHDKVSMFIILISWIFITPN